MHERALLGERLLSPAGGRAGHEAWRASYVTTGPLEVRLDTMRRFYRATGQFGLDVLPPEELDGRSVLEIGPGTGGHVARFFARTGVRPQSWVLLDRSEAMVRTARAAIGPHCATVGVVGDADRVPLRGARRFDWIVAMHVLPFARSPRRVIAALGACLAPGGRLLLTTPGTSDMAPTRRLVRSVVRERGLPWRTVATLGYASATAERHLRAAFDEVTVHAQRGELEFPDADAPARYIGSMAWIADAPRDACEAVERAVRAAAARDIARHGVHRMPKLAATFVAAGPRG